MSETDDPLKDDLENLAAIARPVDEAKANSPPRAVDVYLIASRLKRMITAVVAAQLSGLENDPAAAMTHIREFQEISRGLELLLRDLVLEGRTAE